MLQKNTIFILIILIFPMIISFAQEEFSALEQKNAGIVQMKEAVSKLSSSMTMEEAEKLLGEPTFETDSRSIYWFAGGERLTLSYINEISLISLETGRLLAYNKDTIDLLEVTSLTSALRHPILIDGKKLLSSNPIVTISGNIYISIKDLADQFGIEVSFDKEKLQPKTITRYVSDYYLAEITDIPTFIDAKKLVTSNPIVTINGNMYLPIEELSGILKIEIIFDKDKRLYEITTNVSSSTNEFDQYYPAIVTDIPIYIDDNKLLTFNPIVAINGNIYLPIDELEEELQVKVDHSKEKPKLEITTGMGEGFAKSKDIASISRFKEDFSELHKGMTENEVKQVLSRYLDPKINYISMNDNPPKRYIHENSGIILTAPYGNQNKNLSALFNEDGFDLLATGYVARLIDFPVFIDGKELLTTSNPIVTIHNKVYVSIEDFAEQLGMKVSFNEEKQQLEITTK